MNLFKKKFNFFFLLLFLSVFSKQCIIIKNISNCYIADPNEYTDIQKIISFDDSLYSFAEKKSQLMITRFMQCRYGEILDIISSEEEIKKLQFIHVKNDKYGYISKENNNELFSSNFWVNKKDVILIDDIPEEMKIYIPYWLSRYNGIAKNLEIKTLVLPLLVDNIWYPIGSQFVFLCEKGNCYFFTLEKNNNCVQLKKNTFIKNKSIFFLESFKNKSKRSLFIKLLNNLNEYLISNNLIIPYMWGGGGIIPVEGEKQFSKKKVLDYLFWTYDSLYNNNYSGGVDCSALINIFANLAQIDFKYRNSSTQKKYLNRIKKQIKQGDILWIPGHVMILDIKNNTIIESAGYSSGFGKFIVQKIYKRIKDINSMNDLFDLYKKKEPLLLINSTGDEITTYKEYEILSLM